MFQVGFRYTQRSFIVTSRIYRGILEEYFSANLERDSIFIHDNAPVHIGRIVREGTGDNNLEAPDWPLYLPDLYFIENA
jgi:hypothetical protein